MLIVTGQRVWLLHCGSIADGWMATAAAFVSGDRCECVVRAWFWLTSSGFISGREIRQIHAQNVERRIKVHKYNSGLCGTAAATSSRR